MMRWYNSRPLSVKFLLLALPPSILVGLVFLGFVLLEQKSLMEENNLRYSHNLAQRDAKLLSRPLWNLEESSVLSILETIKTEPRLTCLQLVDVLGFENYPVYGNCNPKGSEAVILQPIVFEDLQGEHQLGALKVAFDITADSEVLFRGVTILGGQILLMLVVISTSIFWGFQATILRPMSKVSDSIKHFRETGLRQSVDWDTDDELGQLIREYNSGLISQQESERAILQASEEFETTVQNLPFALAIMTNERRIALSNSEFNRMFGFPEWNSDQLDEWIKYVFPEEMYREETIALMTIHINHANKTGRLTDPLVRRMTDTQGRTRIIEIRYFLLEQRGVFTFADITTHKQAEREIAKSAERFEITIMNLPFALVITNNEHELEMVNSEFTRLFGYENTDIDSFTEWLSKSQVTQDIELSSALLLDLLYRENVSGQVIGPIEARFNRKDGQPVLIETRLLQLADRSIWAMTDITARNEAEKNIRQARDDAEQALNELKIAQGSLVQAEKLASLGSLVAGIAHEINTPVGIGVTVASSLSDRLKRIQQAVDSSSLRKSDFDQFIMEVEEATGLLNTSLGNAAHLIQNFKQVAADQTSSQRRVFDLHIVITEVLTTLGPTLKHTQHKIIEKVTGNIVLDSYPGPLGQIITNLVTNALIHGFEGIDQGTIELKAELDETQQFVILLFSDNGKGMATDQQARMFDPFYTTRMGEGGTGLGLNIVYNITNNILGGSISVSSKPDKGTSFTFKLPVRAPVTADQELT
ncbi:ATP-binding protein [Aestuariirhabdus sp. Z084]|uniref:PAS domain-containing sensor histidine kinase n=1 Tax=Aestuariirhabdus haliotis TaxID=2918751 RepID=UPI00201B383E|nr:PAS domain-containing sensor histidine kinase [Aestuariirhabdus haliotis]MCL6417273.1 ATP-binding protein [Aestuariirhabdus haliotis]MCL6421227.1 ATP-binding protein [Aestuariirhabdus haliotis]